MEAQLRLTKVAQRRLIDLHELAELFQLSALWLKTEAEQDRIPSLKVDREYMFDAVAVRDALFKRASEQVEAVTV